MTTDADRQQLLVAAKRLQAASESPLDAVVSIVLSASGPDLFLDLIAFPWLTVIPRQIHREAAIRTAVEMRLFDVLVDIKEESVTAAEVAKLTNSDEVLISAPLLTIMGDSHILLLLARIMRFVTALGYSKELRVRHYTSTPRTSFFVTGSPLRVPIIHMFVLLSERENLRASSSNTDFPCRATHSQVLVQLPEYFQKYGYKNPTDINSGPFQFAMNYNGTYFEWLKSIPVQQETFNRMMAITRLERGEQWFDFFLAEERFGSTDPSQVLLVDIGGGLGYDLVAFHARFPNLPGKLILQDLPTVINDIQELSRAFERTIYDFFTPQPIKRARAYYMRTILHDFPDKQSVQILKTGGGHDV